MRLITRPLEFIYYCLFKRRYFLFQGRLYKLYYSLWNVTFRNERAVEIPIILDIVKIYKGRQILEVGNVLHWYYKFPHNIVDKYEKGKYVINKDIVDYHPLKKYDLIVSVSTLEHIGYDCGEEKDRLKVVRAVENMKSLLKPDGIIVVTVPIGFNKDFPFEYLIGFKWSNVKRERGYEVAVGYYHLQTPVV